uniref:Uncharacterized protein n=1 Tax=Anopheles dirus TaxID=7168 RepID=A0A182NX00_9DIPT
MNRRSNCWFVSGAISNLFELTRSALDGSWDTTKRWNTTKVGSVRQMGIFDYFVKISMSAGS